MSLNEGYELDENESKEDRLSELVFDHPQDGVTPELDNNVTLIAADVAKYDRVSNLNTRLAVDKAIDQTTALEAHYLTGNFINESNPISMYSTWPTRTGLNAAMESLDGEKKNILVRLYEKIKEYIKKVIVWFGGLINRKPNPMDQKEVDDFFGKYFQKKTKIAQGVVIVQKRREDLFGRLNDLLKRKGEEQAILDSVDVFGQKVLEYFEKNDTRFQTFKESLSSTPLVVAMMGNSDYFGYLAKFSKHVEALTAGLENLVDLFASDDQKEVYKESVENARQLSAEFGKEILPIRTAVENINESFERLYQGTATKFASKVKDYTIEEFLEDSQYINAGVSDKAFKDLTESSSKIKGIQDIYDKLLSQLETSIAGFEEAKADKSNNGETIEILQRMIRELLSIISEGSQATTRYYAEVNRAQIAANKITAAAIGFVEGVSDYVKKLIEAIPEEARDDVRKYMEGIGFDLS